MELKPSHMVQLQAGEAVGKNANQGNVMKIDIEVGVTHLAAPAQVTNEKDPEVVTGGSIEREVGTEGSTVKGTGTVVGRERGNTDIVELQDRKTELGFYRNNKCCKDFK